MYSRKIQHQFLFINPPCDWQVSQSRFPFFDFTKKHKWVSIVSMVGIAKMSISIVTIEVAGISRCVSLASSSGEHAQGDNGNGFHHFVACKLEDLARLPC